MNLVENLAPFAALVIIAQLTDAANEMTALGARLFFWARLAQIVLHTAGVPRGRQSRPTTRLRRSGTGASDLLAFRPTTGVSRRLGR